MSNTAKVVAGATETPVWVQARNALGEATRRGYGLQSSYAVALNERWSEPNAETKSMWFEVGGKDVNDFAKEVNGERDAFYASCVEGLEPESIEYKRAHGAARTQWSRVRDIAAIKAGFKEESDNKDNSEKPLDEYLPEIYLTIYKRIARNETRSANARASLKATRDLLVDTWKVDISSI